MRRYLCLLLVIACGCALRQQLASEPFIEAIEVSTVVASTAPPAVEKQAPTVEVVELPEQEQIAQPTRVVEHPVSDEEWNEETKLWLARSLLGEVGWLRPAEQSAVAWVYATRAKISRSHNFIEMVKQYSAAIRSPGKRRSPWLFELGFDRERPSSWPSGPRWEGLHDEAWIKTLELVDRWQAGEIPNYCPSANHFGGYIDRHRAEALRWTRVKCVLPEGSKRFRNRFYDSTKLQPKRQTSRWRS